MTSAGGGHFPAGLGDLGSSPPEARPQQSASAGQGWGLLSLHPEQRCSPQSPMAAPVALSPSGCVSGILQAFASAHGCSQMKGFAPLALG